MCNTYFNYFVCIMKTYLIKQRICLLTNEMCDQTIIQRLECDHQRRLDWQDDDTVTAVDVLAWCWVRFALVAAILAAARRAGAMGWGGVDHRSNHGHHTDQQVCSYLSVCFYCYYTYVYVQNVRMMLYVCMLYVHVCINVCMYCMYSMYLQMYIFYI